MGKGDSLQKGYRKKQAQVLEARDVSEQCSPGAHQAGNKQKLGSFCSKCPGALEEGGRGVFFLEENLGEGEGYGERA